MLPIVYVHLGDKSAPHLIDSMRQTRRMTQTADILAILTPNTVMAEDAAAAGATVLYSDSLAPVASHEAYVKSVWRRLGKKRGGGS